MRSWQQYWQQMPASFDSHEFYRQVGKTIGGVPVGEEQLSLIVRQIVKRLAIQPSDRVLDLCCGNGLVTYRVASHCNRVWGVDYSEPLIRVARQYHGGANVAYLLGSVLDVFGCTEVAEAGINKIYMYEALQHFSFEECRCILEALTRMPAPRLTIYFGSVPDAARIWNFYNTPERQAAYRAAVQKGEEAIGTWWKGDELQRLASAAGFRCAIHDQDPSQYTGHYRFDLVLDRGI